MERSYISDIIKILRELFHDERIRYTHSRFAGGMTNRNYLFSYDGQEYVVREPGFKTEIIIDRLAEEQNNLIVSEMGINSECLYFDSVSGIKVSRFIENARTFSEIRPSGETAVSCAAALLEKIHSNPVLFRNVFRWDVELSKYEEILRTLNCGLFSDYEQLKADLLEFLDENQPDLHLVSCHNDTVPENFILDTDSGSSYLIDWEYSGLNDAAWDIGMYIAESRLRKPAIRDFFTRYYKTAEIPSQELIKIKCMLLKQDLLWSVWAMIRHYNGEDYLDYIHNRYSRFRRNLSMLKCSVDFPLEEMVQLDNF